MRTLETGERGWVEKRKALKRIDLVPVADGGKTGDPMFLGGII